MRGRPPKYTTPEERAEARREASRAYRTKRNQALTEALKRAKQLEREVEVLKELNESGSDRGTATLVQKKLD
jgi:hypothetical protein